MEFLARWPITDPDLPLRALIAAARPEVPALARQAHCRLTGAGVWAVADSRDVPGSGGQTPNVLVYRAPAVAVVRDYHRRTA